MTRPRQLEKRPTDRQTDFKGRLREADICVRQARGHGLGVLHSGKPCKQPEERPAGQHTQKGPKEEDRHGLTRLYSRFLTRNYIIRSTRGRHKQGPALCYRRVPSPWVDLGQSDPGALMFRGLRGRVKWVVWTRASTRNQGPLTHTASGTPVSACLSTLPRCSGLG